MILIMKQNFQGQVLKWTPKLQLNIFTRTSLRICFTDLNEIENQ